jgi:uncharacterized protein (DUF169 family)
MDLQFKNTFLQKWATYFGDSDLPITFFYVEDPGEVDRANLPKGHSCIVCELAIVRKGRPLAWNVQSLGCGGARRYLGYADEMRPDFNYFLSYGIPGKVEGERYIKTPEMVSSFLENTGCIPAGGRYIVFKRFDQLTPDDEPVAVIFFAQPDVLSGLFTLANYDQPNGDGVFAPFGSGCGSIIYQPYKQQGHDNPKAILGMFDASARPCVPKDTLSFAVPMKKFESMVGNMDESFLITETWKTVKKRIEK